MAINFELKTVFIGVLMVFVFTSFQFEINHVKNEHLESVEGYYDHESGYIQGLQFKTNFRVSELIGYEKGNKFTLEVKGKKISGFHGYMRKRNIIALGAYFTMILPSRLDVKGGKGGHQWDDGANHDGVTKIHVRGGFDGIQYIKFNYVKNGETQDGPIHGISGSGFTQTVYFKITLSTIYLICNIFLVTNSLFGSLR